jgi:hypothetical protein
MASPTIEVASQPPEVAPETFDAALEVVEAPLQSFDEAEAPQTAKETAEPAQDSPLRVEMDPFKAVAPETSASRSLAVERAEAAREDVIKQLGNSTQYVSADEQIRQLGDAICAIAFIKHGGLQANSRGYLARFFDETEDKVPLYKGEMEYDQTNYPYTPDNFDCGALVSLIINKFSLDKDDKFTLFVLKSLESEPEPVSSIEHMASGLADYEAWFKQDPTSRHIIFFFVVCEDKVSDNSFASDATSSVQSYPCDKYYSPPPSPTSESDCDSNPELPNTPVNVPDIWPIWKRRLTDAFAGLSSSFHRSGAAESGRSATEPDVLFYNTDDETCPIVNDKSSHRISYSLGPIESSSPKQCGVLASLETDPNRDGDVEDDISILIPLTTQPTDREWAEACRFLLLNPDEHKAPTKRSIQMPWSEIWLTPAQYWAAFWMITSRSARDMRGGLFADGMGIGKTHPSIANCMLRSLIQYNRAEVLREWDIRAAEARSGRPSPKKHLPADAAGNTSCPCGNTMGIECYANPEGTTRRVAECMARGASLIMAGASTFDDWQKVLVNGRLNRKYYEPVAFAATVEREVEPAPDLAKKLKADIRSRSRDGFQAKDWKPTVRDADFKYEPSKEPARLPERYLILTTHNPIKFMATFSEMPFHFIPKGSRKSEKRTMYGCPIGMQLVDEWHRVMKTQVFELAMDHLHMWRDNFDFWAVSGTPTPNGTFLDLRPMLSILQQPEWDNPEHRHHYCRVSSVEALAEAYTRATSEDGTPEDVTAYRDMPGKLFASGLMTRRTETSKFFDKLVSDLEDVKPRRVTHMTPDIHLEAVQKIADVVKAQVETEVEKEWAMSISCIKTSNHLSDLSILSTFPGAAQVMREGRLDFRAEKIVEKIKEAEDRDISKVAAFRDVIDDVTHASGKLGTILAMVGTMLDDKKRRPRKGKDGRDLKAGDSHTRKKMVIISPRLAEAVFTCLALRERLPDVKIAFLHKDLKLSQRKAILEDFQSHREDSAQIFVSSFGDGGTGINLFAANYQILTGPMRLKTHEAQAFGRTNRRGQTLPCKHLVLVTEDNPVDRIVCATHARRRIVSDPFLLAEQLRIE